MSDRPAMVLDHVTKIYRVGLLGRTSLRALDDVSLCVEPGEIFGLVGPNRAGKTTLVKLLLSLCAPTHGVIERLGQPAHSRASLARVGYVHENHAFPRYLSARALLEYYGALSLLSETVVKQRVPALLERVALADRSDEPISRFSKGMVQRLGMAQALINDPELLVLDEPSEGLDLSGRQLLREVMAEQRRAGRTVLYVSHLLHEIEQVCDRIGVLVAGRLRFFGPAGALTTDVATGVTRTLEQALEPIYHSTN